jgi:hypothetical protein
MDSVTLRLICLLTAVCVLAGINTAAAVLKVPVVTATIGDVISVIIVTVGILLGTRVGADNPPKKPPMS